MQAVVVCIDEMSLRYEMRDAPRFCCSSGAGGWRTLAQVPVSRGIRLCYSELIAAAGSGIGKSRTKRFTVVWSPSIVIFPERRASASGCPPRARWRACRGRCQSSRRLDRRRRGRVAQGLGELLVAQGLGSHRTEDGDRVRSCGALVGRTQKRPQVAGQRSRVGCARDLVAGDLAGRLEHDRRPRGPPAVDRLPTDASRAGDRIDGQPVGAALPQQPQRRVQDGPAGGLVAPASGVRSRPHDHSLSFVETHRLGKIVETHCLDNRRIHHDSARARRDIRDRRSHRARLRGARGRGRRRGPRPRSPDASARAARQRRARRGRGRRRRPRGARARRLRRPDRGPRTRPQRRDRRRAAGPARARRRPRPGSRPSSGRRSSRCSRRSPTSRTTPRSCS